VNAISAGLIRTLAGAGIADGRVLFTFQKAHSPLRRGLDLSDIGGAALYLLSNLSSGVTGEIHSVDAGYNIVHFPHPDSLKAETGPDSGLWFLASACKARRAHVICASPVERLRRGG